MTNVYNLRSRAARCVHVTIPFVDMAVKTENGQCVQVEKELQDKQTKTDRRRRVALAQLNHNIPKTQPAKEEASQSPKLSVTSVQPLINDDATAHKDSSVLSKLSKQLRNLSLSSERIQKNNIFLAKEDYIDYAHDVLAYLVHHQKKPDFQIPSNLLSNRAVPIKPRTYAILVDYITQLHMEYSLPHEVLDLSLYLLNRTIAANEHLDKQDFQAITISSLLVASKYESGDSWPMPFIDDLLKICEYGVTRQEILDAELRVLHAADLDLSCPGPSSFLEVLLHEVHLAQENKEDSIREDELQRLEHRAYYFKECLMHSSSTLSVLPASLAAVCLLLAARCTKLFIPINHSAILSACALSSIDATALARKCAIELLSFKNLMPIDGVHCKYSTDEYLHVSDMERDQLQIIKRIASGEESSM